MANSELKAFTCGRCGDKFTSGKWSCEDGQRHVVESKTYHIKTQGLNVYYGPVHGDNVINHHRGVISFARGAFQTADPEQQEFLDQYPGCIPADEWTQINLTEKEREEQSKREKTRLEKTNNDLLDKVKALEAQVAAKGDGKGGK